MSLRPLLANLLLILLICQGLRCLMQSALSIADEALLPGPTDPKIIAIMAALFIPLCILVSFT